MAPARGFGRIALAATALHLAMSSVCLAQSDASPASAQAIESALSAGVNVDRINEIIQVEIPAVPGSDVPARAIAVDANRSVDLQVHFAYDSDQITPAAQDVLKQLGEALMSPKLADQQFLLAGHTDTAGSAAYNLSLSDRRAKSVFDYLTKTFDISEDRFVVAGFGETRLADPENGRSQENRRVEITVIAN